MSRDITREDIEAYQVITQEAIVAHKVKAARHRLGNEIAQARASLEDLERRFAPANGSPALLAVAARALVGDASRALETAAIIQGLKGEF